MWDSMHKNLISTLQQFLERVEKYMKLDDAMEKIDKGVNPSSSNPPKINGNDNGSRNGADDKKRGNNRTGRHDDKKTKFGFDKKSKYEPKFTNYTALKASREEEYLAAMRMSPIGDRHHSRERKTRRTSTSTSTSTMTMVMRQMSACT